MVLGGEVLARPAYGLGGLTGGASTGFGDGDAVASDFAFLMSCASAGKYIRTKLQTREYIQVTYGFLDRGSW